MCPFPSFRLRFDVFCIFAVWSVFGLSTVFGETMQEDAPLGERLLQRAETYLNSRGEDVISHAMVVRGLLYAGVVPEHPFIRAKVDVLLRLTPRNDTEAARQREIALLVRASENRNALPPSKNDAATLRAAVVSDYCNDHYKRFGVVRLPLRFPGRPNAPPSEHEPARFMVAVHVPSSPSRSVDVIPTLNTDVVSFCSTPRFPLVRTDKPTGYILVAQTVRLRN